MWPFCDFLFLEPHPPSATPTSISMVALFKNISIPKCFVIFPAGVLGMGFSWRPLSRQRYSGQGFLRPRKRLTRAKGNVKCPLTPPPPPVFPPSAKHFSLYTYKHVQTKLESKILRYAHRSFSQCVPQDRRPWLTSLDFKYDYVLTR